VPKKLAPLRVSCLFWSALNGPAHANRALLRAAQN
jgi:hypothetical protein